MRSIVGNIGRRGRGGLRWVLAAALVAAVAARAGQPGNLGAVTLAQAGPSLAGEVLLASAATAGTLQVTGTCDPVGAVFSFAAGGLNPPAGR